MKASGLNEQAIGRLVDEFYTRVRADPQLGPVFERAITEWEPHLATMRDFWSSIMLTSGRYKGNPVAVHRRVDGMDAALFGRWLELFDETCRELFDREIADAFQDRATRIAESLKFAVFHQPDMFSVRSAP